MAVGSTSIMIGGASLFLFPLTIGIQTNTGLMLRYLALGIGLTSGGILVGVGFKLRSIKPLLHAAKKVEESLMVNQLAIAQIHHQRQLESQLQQPIQSANHAPSNQPETVPETRPPETEREDFPNPENNVKTSVSEPETVEIEAEIIPETSPESRTETVKADAEIAPNFPKDVLHGAIIQGEMELLINLHFERGMTSKQELIHGLWGPIKAGGSKDYKQASAKLNQIFELLESPTPWN